MFSSYFSRGLVKCKHGKLRGPAGVLSLLRNMFIQVHQTPNPNSLKFTPGMNVLEGTPFSASTLDIPSINQASRSPLARHLFRVEGVKGVLLGPDFITITKVSDMEWSLMKPDLFAVIQDFFSSNLPVVKEGDDGSILNADAESTADVDFEYVYYCFLLCTSTSASINFI